MAVVNCASYNRTFKSNIAQFDLGAGRVIWQETVGIIPTNRAATATVSTNAMVANLTNSPPNEELRTYVLVANRVDRGERLYARVENESNNTVYGTISLGILVGFGKPDTMIDKHSHLHVVHQ